jgi:PhnB protein
MTRANSPIPEGFHTVTPVLTVDGAQAALDWYERALGAAVLSKSTGPDGKIVHSEIRIGNSKLMVHDPMMEAKPAKQLGGSPILLWIYVDDCDALFARAKKAGGSIFMPIEDQFWGDRCGSITDPFGLNWTIATRKEDLTRAELDARQAEFFEQAAVKAR